MTGPREKEGGPAEPLVEDGRGHDGRDDARENGLEFELGLPVEDLRGEQGGSQGSVENGADATGGARQDQDAAFPGLELKEGGQKGAKAGADLGYGSLFPGGAAAADGDGRGDDFDKGDALADIAAPGVEGFDHGVGAMALRLRSDEKNYDSGNQAAQGRND